MDPASWPGVFREGRDLFTRNPRPGERVYGEELRVAGGVEYRLWDPFRSKLVAMLLKGAPSDAWGDVRSALYLGAAHGTTVSHFSDLWPEAEIFAVEKSPTSFARLLALARRRTNLLPLLADAQLPEAVPGRRRPGRPPLPGRGAAQSGRDLRGERPRLPFADRERDPHAQGALSHSTALGFDGGSGSACRARGWRPQDPGRDPAVSLLEGARRAPRGASAVSFHRSLNGSRANIAHLSHERVGHGFRPKRNSCVPVRLGDRRCRPCCSDVDCIAESYQPLHFWRAGRPGDRRNHPY